MERGKEIRGFEVMIVDSGNSINHNETSIDAKLFPHHREDTYAGTDIANTLEV